MCMLHVACCFCYFLCSATAWLGPFHRGWNKKLRCASLLSVYTPSHGHTWWLDPMWSQVKPHGISEQQWAPVVPHTSGAGKWICPASHNHLPTFGLNSTLGVLWVPYRQERLRMQTPSGSSVRWSIALATPVIKMMPYVLVSIFLWITPGGLKRDRCCMVNTKLPYTLARLREERMHKLHCAVKVKHRRTAGLSQLPQRWLPGFVSDSGRDA